MRPAGRVFETLLYTFSENWLTMPKLPTGSPSRESHLFYVIWEIKLWQSSNAVWKGSGPSGPSWCCWIMCIKMVLKEYENELCSPISRSKYKTFSVKVSSKLCNSCVSSSNFTPQVKKARNQSQIFNSKLISRNTTHRQSYHLIHTEWDLNKMIGLFE